MLSKIIAYSVRNPIIIILGVLVMAGFGWRSLSQIPLDAVPDITNNQVQIVTQSPSLSAEEVEQFITYPLELTMTNLPGVVEVRSISKFGLSILTVIFEEEVADLEARQLVSEQLVIASKEIPSSLGTPEMMPITTGLGEIYQYVLTVSPDAPRSYTTSELRTLQDWVIKRQLGGIPGIIEISSFGGYVKQYEVVPIPEKMQALRISLSQLAEAVNANNQSTGGSYYTSNDQSFYVRAQGRLSDPAELLNIPVQTTDRGSVLLRDVAHVQEGHAVRFGAMTKDGQGEVVGGITLMLKGDNAHATVKSVRERIESIQSSLPVGVSIEPYLDRSALVDRTTQTVAKNLLEGGLIVIIVLVLMLGNVRAGLVVASIIPLAMLFALILMNSFGVSANLMSLGAIDFGIVVDGAVIIAEHLLAVLSLGYLGKKLTRENFQDVVISSSLEMVKSAVFGVLIILVVFIPIITLVGIEGKMFRPMAQTVSFALLGALLLSITYVPAVLALVMKKGGVEEPGYSKWLVGSLKKLYVPVLGQMLRRTNLVMATAVVLFGLTVWGFLQLGSEFIPKLDEGDLAAQMQLPPGTSLEESIATSTKAEQVLMENFPQVKHVVSKIGTAEVPTDPMSIEQADMMVILHNPELWPEPLAKEELVNQMAQILEEQVPYGQFEFTQPIELRFNELISGAKSDVAVKLFGADFTQLSLYADQIVPILEGIDGAVDVKREQTDGLNQRHVVYDRMKMAALGVQISEANATIESAFAGSAVSTLYEEDKRFDVVIRFNSSFRNNPDLNKLVVTTRAGALIPMSSFAKLSFSDGPSMISRENSQRRIVIGCNVRGRDIESVVLDIQDALNKVDLPPGYFISYGGDFEQLQEAKRRLSLAVPIALAAIFVLLFLSFRSLNLATMVFASVPLSTVGGVAALAIRGMPFSISAGIGFIALFGVAVLNGIVMIAHLSSSVDDPKDTNEMLHLAAQRLRPVLMTAFVAALGFLPMALSTGAGAEVQKPLATVVIGGLVTATLLTLIVLPVLYSRFGRTKIHMSSPLVIGLIMFMLSFEGQAQNVEVKTFAQAQVALKENGLRSSQARMEVEKVRALNAKDWNVPISGQWQRGQINGDFPTDYFNSIEVFLPSLTAGPALWKLHQYKMEQAENYADYASHLEEFELHGLWLQLIEAQELAAILTQHYILASDLQMSVQNRNELGLVPSRDLVRWTVWVENLHHALKLQASRLDALRSTINARLGWPAEEKWTAQMYTPESIYPSIHPEEALVLATVQADAKVAQGEWGRSKSAWLPGLGVGVFTQKLEGTPGFNGVQLSTSMPLSPHVYVRSVQASKIAADQMALEVQWATREWAAICDRLEHDLERWGPEAHHEPLTQGTSVDELWGFYQAGALDLEGLWGAIESQFALQKLNVEHKFHFAQTVAEWNFYQKKIQ